MLSADKKIQYLSCRWMFVKKESENVTERIRPLQIPSHLRLPRKHKPPKLISHERVLNFLSDTFVIEGKHPLHTYFSLPPLFKIEHCNMLLISDNRLHSKAFNL